MTNAKNTAKLPECVVIIYDVVIMDTSLIRTFDTYQEGHAYIKNIDPYTLGKTERVAIYSLNSHFVPKIIMDEVTPESKKIDEDRPTSIGENCVISTDYRLRKIIEGARPEAFLYITKETLKNNTNNQRDVHTKNNTIHTYIDVRYLKNYTGESFYIAINGDRLIFIDQERSYKNNVMGPDGYLSVLQNMSRVDEDFGYDKNNTRLYFVSPSDSQYRYNGYPVITEDDIWFNEPN